jgi:hypothetical protein
VAFELPPLPYDYAALEPTIDEATMKLHHDKHHQAYVTNLNGAVEKHPDLGKKTPEELVSDLASVPEDVKAVVRNNGGGHVNHTMFWEIMKPGGGGDPTGDIGTQIETDFGSFADFKKKFNEQAVRCGVGLPGLQGRQARDRHQAEPGFAPERWAVSDPWQRCLGARLLPEVQQPPARLPRGVVGCHQLG